MNNKESECQVVLREEPKMYQLLMSANGLKSSDIIVTIDPKSGTLEITGKASKDIADKYPEFDLAVRYKGEVPKKFISKPSKVVEYGILTVEFKLSDHVLIAE